MEKPRLKLSDKNFATDPKNQKIKDEKHGVCDNSAKTSPKNDK